MNDTPDPIDPTIAATTTKNIRLAARFVRGVIDNPAILDTIPGGTTVVLQPVDDPELAANNARLAAHLIAEGEPVQTRIVAAPAPMPAPVR